MPYTFGGGTGDDVTWSQGIPIGASGNAALVTGWWRPTTLTAGRTLWSAGNVVCLQIDTVTDELRFISDNTTDGQWTTTGVDMAINNWFFIAALFTANNTSGGALRIWRATPDTPPVEATITVAVARAGNFTGSSSFTVGNRGTGTVAFQGQAANVALISQTATANIPPLAVPANGAIAQAEADYVRDRLVIPHWQGDYTLRNVAAADTFNLNELNVGAAVRGYRGGAYSADYLAVTINGATPSQEGAPRTARLLPTPLSTFASGL